MSGQSVTDLKRILDYYQELYNNTGEEGISDEQFDAMVRYYEDISGQEYKAIGAKSREPAVRLPAFAPSLDKIKDKEPEKLLANFLSRYDADLLCLDKYDGISMFLQYHNGKISLFKRGDGEEGPDVSHLQNYINFPKLPFNCLIRGELVMFESVFEELKPYLISSGNKAINSRTVVNGCTNRLDPDANVVSKCTFIPYGIYILEANSTYGFTGEPILMENQLNMLKSWGFYVPDYIKIPKQYCRLSDLKAYLKQRREKAPYRIDGTVLIFNIPLGAPLENKNPDYAIAIKEDLVKFTKVTGGEWNLTSKDGYMTPVLQVDPILIVTNVTNVTLHNARMVYVNQLGEGDIIAITQGGDIIPKFLWVHRKCKSIEIRNVNGIDTKFYIYEDSNPNEERSGILVSSYPKLILAPNIPYQWNKNGVEIMVINPDSYPQVRCAKIKYFLDSIKVKKWGLLTIWKLYHSGITNIGKLVRIKMEDLINQEQSILEDSATGLYNELQKGLKSLTPAKIMAGSCIFGEGIGEGIMEKFVTKFPNWRNCPISYDMIVAERDFGPVRAKIISDNLPTFINWLNQIPELEGNFVVQVIRNNVLNGKVFCFTGFTDTVAVQEIKSFGGQFHDHWVNAVNVVVCKDVNKSSDKQQHAVKEIEAARREGRQPRIMLINKLQLENELSRIRLSS